MDVDWLKTLRAALYQRVFWMCYLQKSRVLSNAPEDEEADDAYGLLRDRPEDDDEDSGNFNDGHDDDDGVPFSRLQGEKLV